MVEGVGRSRGRGAEGRCYFEEAVAACRARGLRGELARALTGLGQIERDENNLERAAAHYEEAVAIYREDGDAGRVAHSVRHLGDIYRHTSHLERSERCYAEALALYRAETQTSPLELANALRGYALLKEQAGEREQARAMWGEARDLYAGAGVEAGIAEAKKKLASLSQ